MKQRCWHVEGYDGIKRSMTEKLRSVAFQKNQIKNHLMALAAKAGHNFDEIAGAYAKKRTKSME